MSNCTSHPESEAAWDCKSCGKNLCPQCAAGGDFAYNRALVRCTSCGGVAEPIMVPRRIRPYWLMLDVFLKALFFPYGFLQVTLVALILLLASMIPMVGWIVAGAIYASYYFLIIRKTAMGHVKLPLPRHFMDLFEDLLFPFLRFCLATALLWLPAFLYIKHYYAEIGFVALLMNPHLIFNDVILLLLFCLSALYFPAAMITAAINERLIDMHNPLIILGIILRIPKQYFLTVTVWLVLTIGDFYLMKWATPFFIFNLGLRFGTITISVISLFIPLLTALILGRMIYQNSVALEFDSAGDLWVPSCPDAVPMAALPAERHLSGKAGQPPLFDGCSTPRLPVKSIPVKLGNSKATSPSGANEAQLFSVVPGAGNVEHPTKEGVESERTVRVMRKKSVSAIPMPGASDGEEKNPQGEPAGISEPDEESGGKGAARRKVIGVPGTIKISQGLDNGFDSHGGKPSPMSPYVRGSQAYEGRRANPVFADQDHDGRPDGASAPIPVTSRYLPGAAGLDSQADNPITLRQPRKRSESRQNRQVAPVGGEAVDKEAGSEEAQPPTVGTAALIEKGSRPPASEMADLETADCDSLTGTAKELRAALLGREEEKAIGFFELLSAKEETPILEANLEMRLASLLDKAGMYQDAAQACLRAAEKDQAEALAPRAIFTAARLMADKVGDRKKGIELYNKLISKYPENALSTMARQLLSNLVTIK